MLRLYFSDSKESYVPNTSRSADHDVDVKCVCKIYNHCAKSPHPQIMIVAQRIMTMDKCLVYFVDGVKNMADPVLILILAWGLGVAMQDIHTSEYIAGGEKNPGQKLPRNCRSIFVKLNSTMMTKLCRPSALGGNMPVEYFPAVVAIIGYGMSYASGSCMGTQGKSSTPVIGYVNNLLGTNINSGTEIEYLFINCISKSSSNSLTIAIGVLELLIILAIQIIHTIGSSPSQTQATQRLNSNLRSTAI